MAARSNSTAATWVPEERTPKPPDALLKTPGSGLFVEPQTGRFNLIKQQHVASSRKNTLLAATVLRYTFAEVAFSFEY